MEFIFAGIGGFVGGFLFALLYDLTHKTTGVIDVDHYDNSCRVRMTSDDLTNRSVTKAIFKINHDARFSRDEQGL